MDKEKRTRVKSDSRIKLERQLLKLLLLIYDIFVVNMAYFFVLWIRFDMRYTSIPSEMMMGFRSFLPYNCIFCVLVFTLFKLYRSV